MGQTQLLETSTSYRWTARRAALPLVIFTPPTAVDLCRQTGQICSWTQALHWVPADDHRLPSCRHRRTADLQMVGVRVIPTASRILRSQRCRLRAEIVTSSPGAGCMVSLASAMLPFGDAVHISIIRKQDIGSFIDRNTPFGVVGLSVGATTQRAVFSCHMHAPGCHAPVLSLVTCGKCGRMRSSRHGLWSLELVRRSGVVLVEQSGYRRS